LLHLVADEGKIDYVKLLLEWGVNVYLMNEVIVCSCLFCCMQMLQHLPCTNNCVTIEFFFFYMYVLCMIQDGVQAKDLAQDEAVRKLLNKDIDFSYY